MRTCVFLFAIGCSGGPNGGPCGPGREASVTIGLGTDGYTPIEPEGAFPLVHGPQGGFHLELGLFAVGIDASDLVTGHVEGAIDGQVFAEIDPWLDFRCDPDAGGLVSWGTFLVYDATPAFLDGKRTTVSATLTDLDRRVVETTQSFVIRDTE